MAIITEIQSFFEFLVLKKIKEEWIIQRWSLQFKDKPTWFRWMICCGVKSAANVWRTQSEYVEQPWCIYISAVCWLFPGGDVVDGFVAFTHVWLWQCGFKLNGFTIMLLYPRIISVKFRGEILICNVPTSYFAAFLRGETGKAPSDFSAPCWSHFVSTAVRVAPATLLLSRFCLFTLQRA